MADIASILAGGAIGLAGVLVTSAVQVFLNRQAHRQQLERDRLVHARQVLDAKRERLIREYVKASDAAQVYLDISRKYMNGSKDARDMLLQDLHKAFVALEQSVAALEIETDSKAVIRACYGLESAFNQFMNSVDERRFDYSIVDAAIKALRSAMRDSLKDIENQAQELKSLEDAPQQRRMFRFLRAGQ